MSGSIIGDLRVNLGLDSAKFMEGLRQSQSGMVAFGKKMAVVGAGIAAAGAATFAAFKNSTDVMGEMKSQADLAGLTVEQFKLASMAAQQFGIDQGKLTDVLKDVNDKFGEFAQTGGGELKDFFENIAPKVGLTIQSFEGLSSSEALTKYVSALQQAGLSQSEMTYYMEALADEATALIPVFGNNGAALADISAKAREMGFAIDESLIGNAAKVRSEFDLASAVLGVQFHQAVLRLAPAFSQLLAALTPAISGLSQLITWVLNATDAAGDFVRNGILWIIDSIGRLPDAAIQAVTSFAAALSAGMQSLIADAMSWGGQIVAAIAQGLVGLYDAGVTAVADLAAGVRDRFTKLLADAKAWAAELARQLNPANVHSSIRPGSPLDKARNFLTGRDTAKGLADGIRAGGPDVAAAGAGLAAAADGAVRDRLEVRSPSRVMARIGGHVAEGLAQGITENTAGPVSAMQDLASKTVGAFDDMKSKWKGVFSEVVAGTKSLPQAFGDMLGSIASQLQSSGIDMIFEGLWGSIFGGGKGGFSLGSLLPSFAGGGYTWSGARSGGLDGMGGRLAMLHPNEFVNDLTKGSPALRAAPGEIPVRVFVDQDGNWEAAVERISGRVVTGARPGIVRDSVAATYRTSREVKL